MNFTLLNWKPERYAIPEGKKFPDLRERDVTASVMGALFGEHDYVTQWALWQKRVNGALLPRETINTRIGNHFEKAAAQFIETEENMVIEKETGYWREPSYRIGAMLDYWAYKWGDVEYADGVPFDIKIIGGPSWGTKWEGGKRVPPYVAVQLITQMALVKRDRGLIGCFIGGAEVKVIELPFSKPLFYEIVRRVADFHASVAERREPLPDIENDAEAILKLYRRTVPDKIADLTKHNRAGELAKRYLELKMKKSELERQARLLGKPLDEAKAEIFHLMKDAEYARIDDKMILRAKTHNRSGYEVKPVEYRTLDLAE